jgi:hypothetical protein
MEAKVLKRGENTDFPTHTIGTKTKVLIKNKSPKSEGEARVKVGWGPAEMINIGPGRMAAIERDWAGVVGNIFNMGKYELEVWVV